MNLVFSYHDKDADLAVLSAQTIAAQGKAVGHGATIICPSGTKKIDEIKSILATTFNVIDVTYSQNGFDGWPLGPNQMFSDASIYSYKKQAIWYFWEPDCVAIRPNFLDLLEKEYKRDPGIVGDLWEGGQTPSGLNVRKAIIGSAVYPPNLLELSPLVRNLPAYNICYKEQNATPEPWDIYCRNEFLRIARPTDKIKTYWSSVNYQWKGNDIVFFASSPEAQDIQNLTCPSRKVDLTTCVVHGCKDGSFHKLAINKFAKPEEVSVVVAETKPKRQKKKVKRTRRPPSPEEQKRRVELGKRLNEMKKLRQEVLQPTA